MRRTITVTILAALTAVAVAACAPSTPPPTGTSAHTETTTSTPTPTPTVDPVRAAVERMSLAEQASSVVMGTIGGTDPAALRAFMGSGPEGSPLGGFILMGDNIRPDAAQQRDVTAALTLDEDLPPLIAIDQEGGYVSRLPWDRLPGGRALQQDDTARTQDVFTQRARLIADTGANMNFGIIADVPTDPNSFIAPRVLGTDPHSSAQRVAAAVAGEKGIVLSTLKHFPGHGAATGDSHTTIPSTAMTRDQWRADPALPFIEGIDAGAEALMFGHLTFTAVDTAPASLSARWHRIARDDLGFTGMMITDDIGMLRSSGIADYRDTVANAVTALAAGNDMVLIIAGSTPTTAGEAASAIMRAVREGRIPAARLQDAAEHVMALRMQLAAVAD